MGINASIGAKNAVAAGQSLAQSVTELSAAEIELVTKLRKGCSQPGSAQQGRAAAARHLHALGAYLRAAATVRAATEVVPEQYRKRRTARAATPAARVRQTAKAG